MDNSRKTKKDLIAEIAELKTRLKQLQSTSSANDGLNDTVSHDSLFNQIFETNQAIKIIVDPADGKIIQANKTACQFYGYSREEITGKNVRDFNIRRTEVGTGISQEGKKNIFQFPT